MSAPAPRARVLDAADRLFYEHGYVATGVNQVVAEAGVAKASFYAHFPSKDDLALAYLEGRAAAWTAALDAAVGAGGDPAARVLALFDFARAFVSENGMRGCAFLNMAAEFPDAGSAPRRFVARFKAGLRDRVRALVREAVPDQADQRGDAVFLLFEGAIAEVPAVDDLWPIDAARAAAEALLSRSS